jgi:signal transduction histidine kinase
MATATGSAPSARSRRSLAQRVALTFALLCSLVALVQGVAAYYTVEMAEDGLSDLLVAREMDLFRERFRAGDSHPAPSSSRLRGYVVRTAAEHDAVPEFARGFEDGPHEIYSDGRTFHVITGREADARLVLIFDTTVYEDRVQAFKSFVLVSILACSVVALLLGWLLARRLVRPITQVADSLQKLAPGESGRPQGDEAARLLDAFDRYQRQVERLIAQERQITSNASHELRTPLTALRTSCELLQMDPGMNVAARARLDGMIRIVDGMTGTVAASLQFARDHPARIEVLDVRRVVEDVLLPLREAETREGVAIVVDVPADLKLRADRHALQMVLRNLLRNALAHTASGEVRVLAGADWIEVRDTGSGIAPEHLPYVFDRHFSAGRTDTADGNDERYGIGLAIVRQFCDRHGWIVSLRSVPATEGRGHGTIARLEFGTGEHGAGRQGGGRVQDEVR